MDGLHNGGGSKRVFLVQVETFFYQNFLGIINKCAKYFKYIIV